MPAPSLRTLAETCGLSPSTASRALSGHPNVKPEVRARVIAAARRLGYRRNQLVGSLMSHVRSGQTHRFLGTIAIVHVPSPEQPKPRPMQQLMIEAARRRALELSFNLDVFSFGDARPEALGRMLHARGVQGVILLNSTITDADHGFPWEHFAVAEIDYGSTSLQKHTVQIDHHLTVTNTLFRLRELGYRRAGLFIERFKDDRILFKWNAAFRTFQAVQGGLGQVPVLMCEKMTAEMFLDWHGQHKIDLVIGHLDTAVVWLREAGVEVPGRTGFFNLNWHERGRTCAGLDLRPELQGTTAVDTVVAQIQRNERGLPADPHTVMVLGRWIDGPTLRRSRSASQRAQ